MQNFSINIFTTHKNSDRCSFIEKTWGKDIENLFFYTDKQSYKKNYIQCTDKDDYISHIFKNFYAIDYAYRNLGKIANWHFFIGDDVFLFPKNLEKLTDMLLQNENKIYGQVSNTWPNDRSLFYVLGGGGILFNNISLFNFIKNNNLSQDKLNSFYFSDVAIGIICREAKIELVDVPGIYSQPPEFYNIDNPEQFISFHYIKTKEEHEHILKNLHN